MQRIADLLPSGSDKIMPILADAIIAIEAGRNSEGAALLASYEEQLRPGFFMASSLTPLRQPRVVQR